MNRHSQGPERGFSLLELMVVAAILIVVLGSVFGILKASSTSLVDDSAAAELSLAGRRVLNRIEEDFQSGILATMLPSAPSSSRSVSVIQSAGYAGGAVVQGPRVEYKAVADPRDPTNGVDDDQDGFIDELVVVRVEGGHEVPIAGNVKDLRFTLAASHLLVSIQLERKVRGARTFSFSQDARIRLRN